MLRRVVHNFVYDISAIRRYGFFRHIRYVFNHKYVIVNLHFHLDYVPPPAQPSGVELVEIDIDDTASLETWTDIINEAFEFRVPYNAESIRKYLKEHTYKHVTNLFLVSKDSTPVATFFIGRFRNNPTIACAGRFAVRKEYQGRGLGVYLVRAAIDKMRNKGLRHYEETFNFMRDKSIRVFIRAGGVPEFRRRYLQLQPTRKCFLVSWYAKYMVSRMYVQYQEELNKAFRSSPDRSTTVY